MPTWGVAVEIEHSYFSGVVKRQKAASEAKVSLTRCIRAVKASLGSIDHVADGT